MKCQNCTEKKVHEPTRHISKAEYVLVNDDSVQLLCEACHHEYVHLYGEDGVDSFYLATELERAFSRISEVLKFGKSQYRRVLEENSKLKKEVGE